jgi:hypothetical protein
MNYKQKSLLSGLAGLLGFHDKAQALNWNFSYSGEDDSGDPISASGILITDGTAYNQPSTSPYTITGITGIRNGVSIGLLVAPRPGLNNDNQLFANRPNRLLSVSGFTYEINGQEFNVYNPAARAYAENDSLSASNGVSFNVSPVAVPFDLSSTQGAVIGVPLFISLRMLKKRRYHKINKSKALPANLVGQSK